MLSCEVAGQHVTLRVRPQVINLLVTGQSDDDRQQAGDVPDSYAFDRAGRLIGAFTGGRNYRRGLDNRVLQKWPGPDGRRQRRWLSPDEARTFLTQAHDLARQAAEQFEEPGPAVLRAWDWPALEADAQRFAQVYRPVAILPPDQYLALVLQATEGCSYNCCTFCDFYRDRPFHIKSPDQFRAHIAAVCRFFGPAMGLRKSLFLADANALVAPMGRLRAWLDVIDEHLPGRGIYSFIDAFDVHRKSQADWAELSARGLRRVYIGMESGDDELLRFLRKPGSTADLVGAVRTLKQAGVAVSLIVMLGIGGDRYAARHVAATIAALNAMPLWAGDIIYFSPFIDHPGSAYCQAAAQAGLRPLAENEMAQQEIAVRRGLRALDAAHAPKCSKYDLREFVY